MTMTRRRDRLMPKVGKHVWIYGWHPVLHALQNPQRLWDALWITPEQWQRLQQTLGTDASSFSSKIRLVEAKDLEIRVGHHGVHQGIALQAHPLEPSFLDNLHPFQSDGQPSWVIGLDHIEDPQNLGGIIRTAATFGAQGLILTERHAPPISSTVLKASSGGIEHVPMIHVTNLTRSLESLKGKGFWVIGLAEEGDQLLHHVDFSKPSVLVMGSEGSGLRHLTKQTCDQLVRLPTSPHFSTLNVSAAFAVAAYEWVRQKETRQRDLKIL